MSSAGVSPSASRWLAENGPRELELLFRAVVFLPSAPIVITDDEARYQEASAGVARLLGIPRQNLQGHTLQDFAPPAMKPVVEEMWRSFLANGEKEGTLQLIGSDGNPKELAFTAKGNILPVRHVLTLAEKSAAAPARIPSWVQDYALFLLDDAGAIVAWYGGAGRLYGYPPEAALGQDIGLLYEDEPGLAERLAGEFERATSTGHVGTECWQRRNDGTLFWANTVMLALKTGDGVHQGFACLVRDFSERHELDEKLRRKRARGRTPVPQSAIAGVVSGEFDRVPEVNDSFLDIVGYSRDDIAGGRMSWLDMTPLEYAPLDELAHEEALRFGACTPYEKELIRKDGTRVPVLIASAVLKLCPFRWIAIIQDLTVRDRSESVEEPETTLTADFDEIVGHSAGLRLVQQQVEVVAPTDATVLILGETGTGKELVARAIHRLSPRRNLPFVTLNCAVIPTGLLESELFGYERGAFTGALAQKIGRFEMAHRGTLFLDEVGDIPLDLQPKLLRALQEKSFERLGGIRTIPIDVRLIAATNRNLTEMMGEKLFRSDLYYRLKVFPVTTPPLRDRPDDIPLLARHFTRKYAEKMGRTIDKIPTEIMRALVEWRWPGNVRELENFIERSVILSVGPNLRAPVNEIRDAIPEPQGGSTLEQVEREHILRMLRESNGVVTAAATRLGLHRTTLNAMMRKLGISRKDF